MDNMIKLVYKGVFNIPDGEDSCVITLTDKAESRALSIMTHRTMALDLKAHIDQTVGAKMQAVNVLARFVTSRGGVENSLICIDAKKDLGFNAYLEDTLSGCKIPIYPDHAVMLSVATGIDICATNTAFRYFSTPYSANVHTVALPILGLPDSMLKKALDTAVEEEKYEMASFIRDEMNRREQAHHLSDNNNIDNR